MTTETTESTEKDGKVSSTGKRAPSLSDLNSAPLSRAGNAIPSGSYAALFTGFGEPFYFTEKFKDKKPEEKLCIRMYYLLRLNKGDAIERQSERVTLGRDPKIINIKSKLYKRLRAISNEDDKIMDKEGAFSLGITLQSFLLKPVLLTIKEVSKPNGQVFVNVENASAPNLPLNYPTAEDHERMKSEYDANHEEEDDDGIEAIV